MDKFVICYVPGSGGVKLSRLLSNIASVSDFQHVGNSHDHRSGSGRFSLTHQIQQRAQAKPFSCPRHGDDQTWIVFPMLDQDQNLIDPNAKRIGPYVSPLPYAVTHGMSTDVILKRYPDRFAVKIVCDIHVSLRRWWVVHACRHVTQIVHVPDVYQDLVNNLASDTQRLIAGAIIMHLEYYERYYDVSGDYVFDLHRGNDEFSIFMRKDFELCRDSEFDFVWCHVMQHPRLGNIWQKLKDKIH